MEDCGFAHSKACIARALRPESSGRGAGRPPPPPPYELDTTRPFPRTNRTRLRRSASAGRAPIAAPHTPHSTARPPRRCARPALDRCLSAVFSLDKCSSDCLGVCLRDICSSIRRTRGWSAGSCAARSSRRGARARASPAPRRAREATLQAQCGAHVTWWS